MKFKDIEDGINVYFCLQGGGKSYVCTHKVVQLLSNPKNKRIVLSNYPIIATLPLTLKQNITNKILSIFKKDVITIKVSNKKQIVLSQQEKKVVSTYKWEDDYTKEGVRDKIIVIDETHTKYTGAYAYELSKEDRKFFSVLRHNNNSVMVMSQSYEDIHPFLRKRFAYLHEIKKVNRLFSKKPSHFFVDTYITIKDYIKRDDYKLHKKAKKTLFKREKIKFTKTVGNSYNTHFYKDTRQEPKYISWIDDLYGKPTESPKIEIEVKPTIDERVIKDTISTLMRINKWKKKDATLEIYRIISEYDLSKINTVESLLRIALSRQANKLEQKEEKNIEDEEYDDR